MANPVEKVWSVKNVETFGVLEFEAEVLEDSVLMGAARIVGAHPYSSPTLHQGQWFRTYEEAVARAEKILGRPYGG